VGFVGGVHGYLTGTGVLWEVGRHHSTNVDPQLRLNRYQTGCFPLGYEFLSYPANNFALELLVTHWGPMRGSFLGQIPSRDETVGFLLERGKVAPASDGGLPPDELRDEVPQIWNRLHTDEKERLRWAYYDQDTVIVGRELPSFGLAFLVDRKTKTRYAEYFYEPPADVP